MTLTRCAAAALLAAGSLWAFTASAQGLVEVTPLGGKEGEFCRYDRAMVFQDPDGTRILYDVGRTVAGPDDPRLGDIDAVLVSHMHGDHLGDRRLPAVEAGTCAEPDISVMTTPNSNSVEIAVAKGAKIVVGSEMQSFLAGKMKAAGGDPTDSLLVRFGASRKIGGVAITTVPAAHSNGVSPAFIGGELGEHLAEAGLNAYVGPPTGYVLTFSNGLAVYLSGDTGITAEQDSVVRGYYGAKLAVINIGDVFTTGPSEAVYVTDELVQAVSVIPSHANEVATDGGKVVAGTRTESFMSSVKAAAHLPLSGRTMAFDANGHCVEGC